MITIDIETVLIIVIAIITIQLIIVGVYIVMLLRDTRRTIAKAEKVIDDIDKSVKSGIEKATAMQVPLAALATTTTAISGMMKGATTLKDVTKTVISAGKIIRSSKKQANIPVDVKAGDGLAPNNYRSATQLGDDNASQRNVGGASQTDRNGDETIGTVGSVTSNQGGVNGNGVNSQNSIGSQSTDYSIKDWNIDENKSGDDEDVNEGNKSKNMATSLVDNMTTVTPPDSEMEKKETKSKRRRISRPRFFRKR